MFSVRSLVFTAFIALCSGAVENYYLKPYQALNQTSSGFGIGTLVAGNWIAVTSEMDSTCGDGLYTDLPLETERGCSRSGAVFLYERVGAAVVPRGILKVAAPLGSGLSGGMTAALTPARLVVAGNPARGVHVYSLSAGELPTLEKNLTIPWGDIGGSELAVAVHGDRLVVGVGQEDGCGEGVDPTVVTGCEAAGAAYVYHFDGSDWTQEAYLKPFPGRSNNFAFFGNRVAMNADTIAISTPLDPSCETGIDSSTGAASTCYQSGSVSLFYLDTGVWTVGNWLKPQSGSRLFGETLSLSDAPSGAALLAVDALFSGSYVATLFSVESATTTVTQEDVLDHGATALAHNIAAVHDRVVIGDKDSGVARIYSNPGSGWAVEATLTPREAEGVAYGTGVAACYTPGPELTVVVGDDLDSGCGQGVGATSELYTCTQSGIVEIFAGSAGIEFFGHIKPPHSSYMATGQFFGEAVAADGDWLVVGASRDPICGNGSTAISGIERTSAFCHTGSVSIYRREGANELVQVAYLKAAKARGDEFGIDVDIASNTLIVAVAHAEVCIESTCDSSAGAAEVWRFDDVEWVFDGLLEPSNLNEMRSKITSVALSPSGSRAAMGSFGRDHVDVFERNAATGLWEHLDVLAIGPTTTFGEHVAFATEDRIVVLEYREATTHVFEFNGTAFSPAAELTIPEGDYGQHGFVAAEGDIVVVGSGFDDYCDTGVNSAPGATPCQSGAVHVFHFDGGSWARTSRIKPPVAASDGQYFYFGRGGAFSNGRLVVGAPGYDVGRAFVYAVDGSGIATMEDDFTSAVTVGTDYGAAAAVAPDGWLAVSARFETSCAAVTCDVASRSNMGCPKSGAVFTYSSASLPAPEECVPDVEVGGGSTTAGGTTDTTTDGSTTSTTEGNNPTDAETTTGGATTATTVGGTTGATDGGANSTTADATTGAATGLNTGGSQNTGASQNQNVSSAMEARSMSLAVFTLVILCSCLCVY